MSNTKDISTEDHIKLIARRVFLEKGYEATTTRVIAQAAETNVALINYYFRSKEKLFNNIFEDVAFEFFGSLISLFNQDLPLRTKFELFLDKDVEFFLKNPEIPNFMMNHLGKNDIGFFENFNMKERIKDSLMLKQMDIAIQNGEIRNLKFHELLVLIISGVQFVFIAKPMLKHMGDMNDDQYEEFVRAHKVRIKEMVMSYLFLK